MAILIVALVMTSAMIGAAFYSMYVEGRTEMVRSMRVARRGHFANSDRN